MLRTAKRFVRSAFLFAILGGLAVVAYVFIRDRPQDVPWTELDLTQPVGAFTGRKLAALGGDFAQCRALLDRAGVDYEVRPPRGSGQCIEDGRTDPAARRVDGDPLSPGLRRAQLPGCERACLVGMASGPARRGALSGI